MGRSEDASHLFWSCYASQKPSIQHRNSATEIFLRVVVCFLGIVVFPFSCKFHLAAYTGYKQYSSGSGLNAEACLALPLPNMARVPENNQNTKNFTEQTSANLI